MLKNISIRTITLYQRYISPFLDTRCMFYPSCSEYTILAIRKYGFLKGWLKGINRIRKCHPFSTPQIDHI
jgi:putative membrane protein insertion efficiency factor